MFSPVGVIGAGRFGTAIAHLLSANTDVYIYSRRASVIDAINTRHEHLDMQLAPRIRGSQDLDFITRTCTLLFPVVPSKNFRRVMRDLRPYLRPDHLLIHATKGLDTVPRPQDTPLTRDYIKTMSEVIAEETVVRRIGCLSGPNLSVEIMQDQPAATLIASPFREVIEAGQEVLRSTRFQVYGTDDIIGTELAGALKNIIALGSGVLGGLGLGQNIWALLLTRGLSEMIHLGKAMGANVRAFLGVAGIGDLVATASSTKSRNYTVGYRLAQGETLEEIIEDMAEVAEGLRTLEMARALANYHDINVPIMEILYRVFFKGMHPDRAIKFLMSFPYELDVDFL